MLIRKIEKEDHPKIISLTEELSEWFTEEARKESIPLDLDIHKGFLAEKSDGIVGFIILDSYYGDAKIGWIGVLPDRHGEGIGRKLVDRAVEEFKRMEVVSIKVESLTSEDAEGTPYEGTLGFYESLGFELEKVEKGKFDERETDKAIYRMEL